MSAEIEETQELLLDYGKIDQIGITNQHVIPVVVQNIDTAEIILVAYVNEEALTVSLRTRVATFWSTSRQELWVKGATSGALFELLEVYVNCEQNSLVYKVRPRKWNICHTHNRNNEARNCYYRRLDFDTLKLQNLDL